MARHGAHEKPGRPQRRRAAVTLLLLAAAGIAFLLAWLFEGNSGPVAATSSRPTATSSPATVTATVPMNADELRAAFITLAVHDRGYGGLLPAEALPSLAQQTCGTVAAGRNADAVWRAAGDLEQQHGLPTAAAWDFVDVAADTYCADLHMLVLSTTAAMAD
jgi:hypothetical protein